MVGDHSFCYYQFGKAEPGSYFCVHKYIYKAPCGRKEEEKSMWEEAEGSSGGEKNLATIRSKI